jgi:hypothetical protein
MPRVGFEPTTPVLEQAKTVHALDSAATVIDMFLLSNYLPTRGTTALGEPWPPLQPVSTAFDYQIINVDVYSGC